MSTHQRFLELQALRVRRINISRTIKDILFISIGVMSAAFGLKSFLLPNGFLDGRCGWNFAATESENRVESFVPARGDQSSLHDHCLYSDLKTLCNQNAHSYHCTLHWCWHLYPSQKR